jgi:hypothetical protein
MLLRIALALTMSWQTANTVSANEQSAPQIATNRNGQVAVVWQDDRASAGHPEIYLRLWSNGTAGYEKKLSPGGTAGVGWTHVQPDVSLDDRGNAVVVWADDPDGNGVHNIPFRVVSPTGAVLSQGDANASATGDQIHPRVAADPDGVPGSTSAVAFTVVWEDIQGTTHTVKAAGYTGTSTKAYEKIVSATSGANHDPDVAVSASGQATVVWEKDGDIGLTRVSPAEGGIRTANSQSAGAQTRPAIAETFDGEFSVAWESAQGVSERQFDAAGQPKSSDVEATAAGAGPSVGIDDQGGLVVGWTAGGVDGWLRGLNPDGTSVGRPAAGMLTQVTTGKQYQYTLAVSPWGEVAVAYTDDNDGNGFDQVVMGTGGSDNQWANADGSTSAMVSVNVQR